MTARFLCIGTHHKTGTVWMRRTFHKFASDNGIPIVRGYNNAQLRTLPEAGPALVVHWNSLFPQGFYDNDAARFLHIIRDPRDVLISGARYHLNAPLGNEKFLRVPRADLNGASYQEHLNSLPGLREQLLFEMENKHRETLHEMLLWPYGHRNVVDLKFEDLIADDDCTLFRGALTEMAVEGWDIDAVVQYYWDHSLFGGIANAEDRKANVLKHVKSGKPAQWKTKLPREVAEVYVKRYGKALIQLGYAENTDWVDQCPPLAEVEAASAA